MFESLSTLLFSIVFRILAMAFEVGAPVAADQIPEMVGRLDAEMQFLLDNTQIPHNVQAKISESGITSVAIFACIEADAKDFREFVKAGLTIDPGASVGNKVMTAKLVSAWQAAMARGQKRREEEAEHRLGDIPRKLPRKTPH